MHLIPGECDALRVFFLETQLPFERLGEVHLSIAKSLIDVPRMYKHGRCFATLGPMPCTASGNLGRPNFRVLVITPAHSHSHRNLQVLYFSNCCFDHGTLSRTLSIQMRILGADFQLRISEKNNRDPVIVRFEHRIFLLALLRFISFTFYITLH